MTRVAIYIRCGKRDEEGKASLNEQLNKLTDYCINELKTDNYIIFEDFGYSFKAKKRPAYSDMMEQIRNKEFTHLLVSDADRLSRTCKQILSLTREFAELDVTFIIPKHSDQLKDFFENMLYINKKEKL